MQHEGRMVRIHVDREKYESPVHTTGHALYSLADIPAHRELFKEVGGDHEDVLIPRDNTEVRVADDEHFYSQKEVTLVVNTEDKPWAGPRISYEDLAHIVEPNPPPGIVIKYTVEYERGPKANPSGSITAGVSVRVKNRMVFSVTETGRS